MLESGSFYLMRNFTRKLIQKFKIAHSTLTFHPNIKKHLQTQLIRIKKNLRKKKIMKQR
jgi:hypothetical protein